MTANKMALDALTEIREALRVANETPNGPITDTIWMPGRPETLFDAFDAAIAALQAEPQGWMPIETAPKDGTRILVCNKANYVYPARWQGVESGKPADWPQGWRDDVMFVAADGIVSWMPLPTPPKD